MSQVDRHARQFQMHRAALIDLYANLPEEHANFSAWDGGMTFLRLADHLAGSAGRVVSMARGETPGAPPAPSESLADARDRLEHSQENVLATIRALSDDDLTRRGPGVGGQEMAVSELLDMLVTHEAHHKGQVWTMARMVGLTPGRYVKMG
ncbi:DinB family protein [Deinococcus sp. KSM4-11]|uniref:DinB family protein n=1 Tax=Deinococcus sp. KSM4-11 TaxID=2568654 RepID=UPI0010A52D6A|nr:DinB family protein [Deinococcus sp. KSM4-11]THF87716.1 DinB family protein [Deinococcus sp. KSM4-11]